jgi:hypothetical protein
MISTRNHTVSANELSARQAEAMTIALFQQDPRFDLRTVTLDANLLSRLCPGNLVNLSYSRRFHCHPTTRLSAKHPTGLDNSTTKSARADFVVELSSGGRFFAYEHT